MIDLNKKLAIGHCNIQGGLTGLAKSLEVQELIKNEKLDILGLNETNLKPDIDTNTLNLPQNYTTEEGQTQQQRTGWVRNID